MSQASTRHIKGTVLPTQTPECASTGSNPHHARPRTLPTLTSERAMASPPASAPGSFRAASANFEDGASTQGSGSPHHQGSVPGGDKVIGSVALVTAPPAGGFKLQCAFGCGPPRPAKFFDNFGRAGSPNFACKPCNASRRVWEVHRPLRAHNTSIMHMRSMHNAVSSSTCSAEYVTHTTSRGSATSKQPGGQRGAGRAAPRHAGIGAQRPGRGH